MFLKKLCQSGGLCLMPKEMQKVQKGSFKKVFDKNFNLCFFKWNHTIYNIWYLLNICHQEYFSYLKCLSNFGIKSWEMLLLWECYKSGVVQRWHKGTSWPGCSPAWNQQYTAGSNGYAVYEPIRNRLIVVVDLQGCYFSK